MEVEINSYEQERRQKRDKLRELQVDPYGAHATGVMALAEIKGIYRPEMGHDEGPLVKGAGRVMLKRDMGKLSFLTLRDESGDLQMALDKKRLDELGWQVRGLIDLGDLLVIEGKLGTTQKGEVTIWASSVQMAAKALLPPPAKWEGLSDVELRYRQRYVDLWANPQVMQMAKLRIRVTEEIRSFMKERGYVEVETPMMQPLAGGAAAKPFVTHHNALDIPLYMRIAPELYLKRLLVGGFGKVFELNRNFRNEGISPRHNPEFTMLEAYEAFGSWETMAELVESMICRIAERVVGSLTLQHKNEWTGERTIDLTPPWPRISLVDLIAQFTPWRYDKQPLQDACPEYWKALAIPQGPDRIPVFEGLLAGDIKKRKAFERVALLDRDYLSKLTPPEQLMQVYEKGIELQLVNPHFVTRFPSVAIPLAREAPDDRHFADVYELAINGVEISPGYTELNDPDVQAKHFMHQVGDEAEKQKVDEDFLTALKYGMPPAGGLGLGVDRLLMMLTGAESIRDVILFPLMKPI